MRMDSRYRIAVGLALALAVASCSDPNSGSSRLAGPQGIEQQHKLLLELCAQVVAVQLCEQVEMETEVGGVAVIVTRLLEVHAVRLHVPPERSQENFTPALAPTARLFQFRQQSADVVQPQRFAGQVRVRTKISRKIFFEVARVDDDELEGACEKGGRQVG